MRKISTIHTVTITVQRLVLLSLYIVTFYCCLDSIREACLNLRIESLNHSVGLPYFKCLKVLFTLHRQGEKPHQVKLEFVRLRGEGGWGGCIG
jgi:hypothetical protein